MSNARRSDLIPRRTILSLLCGSAALTLALPAMLLPASDANAQTSSPAATPSTSTGGTYGMQRRHERRMERHERREDRRTDRIDRRTERRTGTSPGTTTTGSAPATK
jgi:hypothetical protein